MTIDNKWTFDNSVAERFQTEAEHHIPDYYRVIDLCVDYTRATFESTDIKIIDVGSALGFTIDKFIKQGYDNVHGVDNSSSMINSSLHPARVMLSDTLPQGPWDVVLANWTLHFIDNRLPYLTDIYNNLSDGGLLMLTDKMSFSPETNKLYYDFKRNNGVSDQAIRSKEIALEGVLITKPLSWYLDNLKALGFKDVQVINSRFMFNTICARK